MSLALIVTSFRIARVTGAIVDAWVGDICVTCACGLAAGVGVAFGVAERTGAGRRWAVTALMDRINSRKPINVFIFIGGIFVSHRYVVKFVWRTLSSVTSAA